MQALNSDEYLTPSEVKQLTGGKTFKASQKKALELMGYPYDLDPEGRPLVSRWFARAKACGQDVIAPSGPRLEFVP